MKKLGHRMFVHLPPGRYQISRVWPKESENSNHLLRSLEKIKVSLLICVELEAYVSGHSYEDKLMKLF